MKDPGGKTISRTVKVVGGVIYFALIFAILFDPSELNLGGEFVTLPGVALVIAEGLGNIAWLAGICYLFIGVIASTMMFSKTALKDALEAGVTNGSIENYKAKWHTWPMTISGIMFALIALGSGFWFTGFCWLFVLIVCSIISVRVRKTKEFKECLK